MSDYRIRWTSEAADAVASARSAGGGTGVIARPAKSNFAYLRRQRAGIYVIYLALVLVAALPVLAQSKQQYEIYAIRYATLPEFPVADLVAGADPARKLDLAMMVWLVRGNGRNVLVDSGFYHERFFKDWKITEFTKLRATR